MLMALAVGVVVGACTTRNAPEDDDDRVCYVVDPSLGHDPADINRPYCGWAVGGLPEPPEGFESTRKVFVAFDVDQGEPCDPCDPEHFDALLREKVEEECNGDYELVRGCYVPTEESTNGHCWVAGLYYSNC
ncbi:MAG: hypothetical protein AAF799_25465 [Myxococcota bacterium]